MHDIFLQSFTSTFLSMLKIFLVMFAAGFLVRKKVLTPTNIQGLTRATVDVFLPCMTFSSIMTNLRPGEFTIWWVIPVVIGIMMLIGMGLAALFFAGELPKKRNMLPLAGIHNATYMVLPLGAFLFPEQFDLFSLYVFLCLLGQTPVAWSIGKFMSTAGVGDRFQWKDTLNPPMIAALFALILVFTGIRDMLIPPGGALLESFKGSMIDVIFATIKLLGDATIPVALFILGGVLGGINIRFSNIRWDLVKIIAVKFILLPAMTFLIVGMTGLKNHYPLLAASFIIQSAAPPAIVIILQINRYGGDEQKIGSMLLATYMVCLFALPLWLALWNIWVMG